MSSTTDTTTRADRPGRLGDPARGPATDPRMHPAQLAVLAAVGLDTLSAPLPATRDDGPDAVAALIVEAEAGFEALYEGLPNELPDDAGAPAIDHAVRTIPGAEGTEIALHVYRPSDVEGPLPCVVYLHGGGMVILQTHNRVHRRWSEDLAATGMVVIGVDFRNAGGAAGLHPFPAGLDDCCTAVRWVHDHRDDLGITTVVLQGESGGANLVLATTLRAKRDGFLDAIDGVYASVPYVSGAYAWDDERKRRELPSLVENDGYFIETGMMDLLVSLYDPTDEHDEDPLCWPYFATATDVAGLPPHVVTVNELDPLRDEGIAYYRTLQQAGVEVVGRVNLGVVHAAEMIFRQALPDLYRSTVADIHRFASSR